jgi:hypothetical protein
MSDPDAVIDAELDAEDLPHIHSVRKALHWAGRSFPAHRMLPLESTPAHRVGEHVVQHPDV